MFWTASLFSILEKNSEVKGLVDEFQRNREWDKFNIIGFFKGAGEEGNYK